MKKVLYLLLCIVMVAGCSFTSTATNFNGLPTPDGQAVAHVSTTNIALHLLGGKPLAGDASLQTTVDEFTAKAKDQGASKVRIVQSRVSKWWLIFPPFSIFFTPVISNVAGDAL